MKKILIAVSALALTAGAVSANEISVSTGIDYQEIRAAGQSTEYTGLRLGAEGHYDIGLSFTTTLRSGRLNVGGGVPSTDFQSADITAAWRVPGFGVGPALNWEYGSIGGFSDDILRAGFYGRHHGLMQGLTLSYGVFSDVDNFGDEWRASVRGEYDLTRSVVLTAEVARTQFSGNHLTGIELGGRFNVTGNMDLVAAVNYAEGRDSGIRVRNQGATLGMRFNF